MTTYYVSSEIGNNNNVGTSATAPLATLQAAADLVKPGDTVEVMNGTYTTGGNGDVVDITTSGTASAPITFEAAPGQTPVINSSGSWNAINIEASYIVVNGFTVVGDAAEYTLQTALAGYSTGNPNLDGNGIVVSTPGNGVVPNHITIENNTVYYEPGGGIGVGNADYVQILNNVVYDNAHWSAFGNSGISVAVSQNSDTNPGVHDIISGNISFDNTQLVPTNGGNTITDGEGIILDTNPGFVGEILVENNTTYGNSGPGIESFLTDNAVITGNTAYGNVTNPGLASLGATQIEVNQSNNNTVTNNTTTAPNLTPPAAPVISGDTVNFGNMVTLNGTAEAASTITVFDNSTQLGTTVTNASGAWMFSTGALANGSQSFTATATDSVGNVSPLSSALVMTLNAPVNLVANGNFATGDFTDWTLGGNDTSGQIFMDTNAEGGSTYAAGMGSMGADGTLSQTIATTAGQTYTLSFWLQNEGSTGNDFKAIWNGQTLLSLTNAAQFGYTEYTYSVTATSSTTTLEFSAANGPSQWDLDNISLTANGTSTTTPPAAPVISTGVANSNESVTLTGTAPDGSTVTVSDGGTTALGTATASSTGAWSFTTADLAAGSYAFTATDTTSAGTSAASSAFDVTVTPPPPDPPAAPVISSGVENSNEFVTLTGTAPDGSTVTVSDGGATALGTATASSTGAWSFTTADLAAGSYAFTATDTTSAGTSAASSAFDVTVTPPPPDPPAAPVISSGVENSNESVTLTGTAPDGSTVTVSDGGATALGTATASSTGAWSFTTADLAAGSYTFTTTDTTSAGTSAASSAFDVTVTPPPPAAPVISTGVANSNDSVTLKGSAPDGSTVTVSDGGGALGTATASSTGAWSFTTADLAAASYAFTATDTTSAGTSAASSAFDVTVTPPPPDPPAAPVISTGVENSNESVTLTGTAPDGSTVTVSDGGASALGTATANSSTGAWSFTTAALSAGSYAFTATDTTSAGTSATSNPLDVTVDPPPPAAPVISNGAENSNQSVTLTGTAPAGSTVTVSDGGASALGTATANSSTGAWSFTTAALSAGSYAFTATDTTSAGTSATSNPLDVTVDPPPPAAPVISNGAENSNQSVTLTGTAPAGSTVTVSDGGASALGTATANSSTGAWSFTTAALSAGSYAFTATDTTSAGTSATSNPLDVTVDPPPPAAPVISNGAENSNQSVTLTGTAPAGSTVTVSDGGASALGTATANSSTGAWSFTTAALSAGSYAFTATDTTSAGTSATSNPLDMTVDPPPPAAPVISNGAENSNQSVTLTGTAPAGSTVTVSDGGASALGTATANSSTGAWSFTTAALSAGSYAFTATDTTSAGTSATSNPLDVTVDPPPPAAPVISNGAENSNQSVTLTGTAPAGSTVTVSDGGASALGTATANSSTGAWSFTTAALSAGSYAFTATDTTSAGTSATSNPLDVTVDPPPSAAPVISNGAENSNQSVTLTGTAPDGATVTVSDGGASALGTVTANSSTGAWSFTTAALSAGSYAFTATDTTSAGTSAASSPFDLTVTSSSPPPPAAPVIKNGAENSDLSVTLTGTAPDGSIVTVSDGGASALGTVTANSSTGAWSFTTAALSAGSYTFTTTDATSAGTSAASSPFDLTVTSSSTPSTGPNLVANGNFATGDFTDWTLGGNTIWDNSLQEIFIDTNAEGGSTYAAGMGSMGSDGTLSQIIATTAGQTYTLSFWLQNEESGGNDFNAIWNGQTLLSLTNATQFGYTEYTYTVTATGSTSTLEFAAQQNPSQWDLDNVSLTANGTTSSSPLSVSSIAESPTSGDLGAGKTVTLTLDMSENVTVNTAGGKPTLTLNDGGIATYKSGSGTSALTFTYTVAAGQNTADLSVTKINTNSATIKNGAGNAANLSLSSLTQTGPQIDTSAPMTVGAAATLQIAGADSGSVTFAASTGMLKLDTPSTFSGEIFNFAGNGTLSGSDQIDLTNINFNSVKDRYTNGVLTVTDGTHTDKLNLNGSYTLANFSFASDGSGGTIVYDPPAPTTSSQDTPNATSTGTSGPPRIGTGKTLELTASDPGGAAFAGSAGILILDGSAPAGHALDFTGAVSGFGGQNVIDLPGIAFDAQNTLGYSANSNQTGGTLSLADGTHNANIALLGNYMASSFAMASDGHGGTMIAEATTPNGQSILSNPHHA